MTKRGRPKTEEKHSLINAFGENFWVIPWDGGYCLYDKTRYCKRANSQYLGKFYIASRGDKYVFQDEYYDNTKSLIEAMDEYNKNLPFSPEIYDPTYRKNHQIKMAAYDYLTSLGFKIQNKAGVLNDIYILNDAYEQKICELEIETTTDTTKGIVRRWIYQTALDGRVIEVPFTNLDTAIKAINSQIANYTLMLNVQALNLFKDMTEERATIILDNNYDIKKGNQQYKDARQQTIEYLEKELKRLKSE